jgi:hypothetical protein
MASGKRIGKKSQASNDFLEPLAPTGVTGTNVGTGRAFNNGAVSVAFSLPALSPNATSFTVTASTGQTATGASSPIVVQGIASAATPTFTVTATNAAGTSAASAASSAVTVTTVPQAPSASAVDVGTGRAYNNGAATITVTGGATGGSAITSYTAASGALTSSGSSPLTVGGLSSATAYTFSVTATNANGTSAATTTNSITATTVPDRPTGTAVDVGTGRAYNNGAATITVTAAANGGSPVTSYLVGSTVAGHNDTVSGSSPLTLGNLQSGVSYAFNIIAINANGTSQGAIATNSITATTVPAPPVSPSVTSSVANQDSVSWTAPATGGSAITSYTVTSSDSAQNAPRTNATSPSVFTEVGGTSQTYTIVAINANGTSAGATTGSITTLPPFFPPFFPPYFPPFFPPFFPPYFPPFFPPYFPPFFPPFFPPYFPPYFVPPFFPPFFPPYFPPYFVPPFFPPFFPPYFPPYFVPPFFPPYFVPPYFVPPFFPPYFVPPYFPAPFFPPYFVPPTFGGCPSCYIESNCPSLWCFCTGPCDYNCVC